MSHTKWNNKNKKQKKTWPENNALNFVRFVGSDACTGVCIWLRGPTERLTPACYDLELHGKYLEDFYAVFSRQPRSGFNKKRAFVTLFIHFMLLNLRGFWQAYKIQTKQFPLLMHFTQGRQISSRTTESMHWNGKGRNFSSYLLNFSCFWNLATHKTDRIAHKTLASTSWSSWSFFTFGNTVKWWVQRIAETQIQNIGLDHSVFLGSTEQTLQLLKVQTLFLFTFLIDLLCVLVFIPRKSNLDICIGLWFRLLSYVCSVPQDTNISFCLAFQVIGRGRTQTNDPSNKMSSNAEVDCGSTQVKVQNDSTSEISITTQVLIQRISFCVQRQQVDFAPCCWRKLLEEKRSEKGVSTDSLSSSNGNAPF